jgi:cytochrome b involved in lipid metabolism
MGTGEKILGGSRAIPLISGICLFLVMLCILKLNSGLYSREDVAKHYVKWDLWVILNDTVYDLTDWVTKHPGGQYPILKGAGKDITTQFYRVWSHRNNPGVEEALQKYKIGRLRQDSDADTNLPIFFVLSVMAFSIFMFLKYCIRQS